jgi:hypothetical protein
MKKAFDWITSMIKFGMHVNHYALLSVTMNALFNKINSGYIADKLVDS